MVLDINSVILVKWDKSIIQSGFFICLLELFWVLQDIGHDAVQRFSREKIIPKKLKKKKKYATVFVACL